MCVHKTLFWCVWNFFICKKVLQIPDQIIQGFTVIALSTTKKRNNKKFHSKFHKIRCNLDKVTQKSKKKSKIQNRGNFLILKIICHKPSKVTMAETSHFKEKTMTIKKCQNNNVSNNELLSY